MSNNFPQGRVVFDCETTGLDPWKGAKIFLLGLEDEAGNVVLTESGDSKWGTALKVLADRKVEKIGWNVKFDLKMLAEARCDVTGTVHDAMLQTYMNSEYEPNLKLKDCASRHLERPRKSQDLVKQVLTTLHRKGKKDANFSDVPRSIMRKYLEDDLDDTMRMHWKMGHVIDGPQRRVYAIEREIIPNIVAMERWGVHMDLPYCDRKIRENRARMQQLNTNLEDMAGVRFKHSGPQMEEVMRNLGLDTGVYNGTRMKTGREYTRKFADHPFVKSMVELRALEKVTGTYLENFVEESVDEVFHPDFWPFGSEEHGIKSGRFSSNFQQVPGGGRGGNLDVLEDPKMVRRAVTPRPGYVFLFADYDQVEFAIFACNSGSARLIDLIRKGMDFHSATALTVLGKHCFDGKTKEETSKIRAQAKELNFALLFGMGLKKYAHKYGLTLREASERKAAYFNAIPEARDYMLQSQGDLLRDGYVQDQFGRRYHVPSELCYKAANVLCQGPAALVNKRGINKTFKALIGLDAHPFITVHDELGVEVKKEDVWTTANALKASMEDHSTFPVPLTVKLSIAETSWADKQDWKEREEKWKPKRKSVLTSR